LDRLANKDVVMNSLRGRCAISIVFFFAWLCQPLGLLWGQELPKITGEVNFNELRLTIDSPTEAKKPVGPSEAERLAELQDILEGDRSQLKKLEFEIENPQGEYALAENEYRGLNNAVEQFTEAIANAKASRDFIQAQQLERELESIQRQRKLAEARFELAIEDRKTVREQMQILRSKIKRDEAALAELRGEEDEPAEDREKPNDELSKDTSTTKEGINKAKDGSEIVEEDNDEKKSSEDKDSEDEEEADEEIMAAEDEAEQKEAESEEADKETQSLADRINDVQKLIAQEQKELALAKREVDLVDASQQTLQMEITKRQAENADAKEIADLRADAQDANRRLIHARSNVNGIVERLNDRRTELGLLQSEHIVAMHEAEQKRQEAALAEERLDSLKNPFALRNILTWIDEHGPRLLAIVVGMFLLNAIAKFFSQRSVMLVTTGTGRGSKIERENRAKTLVGVFQNAATVAIFITGFLMILEEAGANLTVLMGGVAVVGLAVAFGAQNLIKDYFYGFVMLLENQYMLNDTIRIGTLSGQVERITLRMTVLRDSNGVVHFVPNGSINSVSNETHGWSRAVCEVSVSYDEDLDRVLEVMQGISEGLYADPRFGSLMLEAPGAPAIDTLGESSIQLKCAVKTQPNKHGAVKQEWLRRIKKQFTQLGIRPPHAQRIIKIESNDIDAKLGPRAIAGSIHTATNGPRNKQGRFDSESA
jgi:moderate conductance mechanosensitive channel